MAGHFYNGRELELLIPASSLEVLKTAVIFGADAVYIGGEAFGLRAKAKNFSMEDMKEGIAFAHAHDVKVYVTANILAHNYDLEGARAYFEELKTIGPDAPDYFRSGDVYDCKGSDAGYGYPHQHTGKQYQLYDVSVLVEAGCKACCNGKRAFFK